MRNCYPEVDDICILEVKWACTDFDGYERTSMYCDKALKGSKWHRTRVNGIVAGYQAGYAGRDAEQYLLQVGNPTAKHGFVLGQLEAIRQGHGSIRPVEFLEKMRGLFKL